MGSTAVIHVIELLTEFTYLLLGSDLIHDNSAYKIDTYGNYSFEAVPRINNACCVPGKNLVLFMSVNDVKTFTESTKCFTIFIITIKYLKVF